jgi:homogentisate 1,2-dioxygenase
VEKALGKPSTDELAVMWDTFKPLRLSAAWGDVDKPEYAYSWNPDHVSASGGVTGAGAGQLQQ